MPYVLSKGLAYGVFLSCITAENSRFYRIFVHFPHVGIPIIILKTAVFFGPIRIGNFPDFLLQTAAVVVSLW